MSKHTPGPWVYQKELGAVDTLFGKLGMDPSELSPVMMLGKGRNMDANGFLISAAPDLLAACKTALDYLNFFSDEDSKIVKKAIAKAEGGI